eukprot:4754715-Pleurochrysis_carterae.AAC.3
MADMAAKEHMACTTIIPRIVATAALLAAFTQDLLRGDCTDPCAADNRAQRPQATERHAGAAVAAIGGLLRRCGPPRRYAA